MAELGKSDLWSDISNNLGRELFDPKAGEEGHIFKRMLAEKQPALLKEVEDVFSAAADMKAAQRQAKYKALAKAVDFFTRANEEDIVRPLALQMGYVPGDFDKPAMEEKLNGARYVNVACVLRAAY